MAPNARRRRPRSTNFDSRREEIIDKAAELFARDGYASTGVADLGEFVQLERGALYYYIVSKESLLADIHDRVMIPLLHETERIVLSDASPLARLRLLSESLLTQVIDRKDHVWVFLHEYRALTGEKRDRFRKRRAQFEAYIDSLLAEGEADGLLTFEGDRRPSLLFFLGTHNYTYQWVRSEPGINARSLSRSYCSIFIRGVASRPIDLDALEEEVDELRARLLASATPATATPIEV